MAYMEEASSSFLCFVDSEAKVLEMVTLMSPLVLKKKKRKENCLWVYNVIIVQYPICAARTQAKSFSSLKNHYKKKAEASSVQLQLTFALRSPVHSVSHEQGTESKRRAERQGNAYKNRQKHKGFCFSTA